MDKVNQLGKTLGKTKKEVNQNIRRGAENFPTPEISVKDFNRLFTYRKTFDAHSDASVRLNVKLKEITTPCSVNPPIINKWCRLKFNDAGIPGTMLEDNGGFILNSDGTITVPDNGCYAITFTSSAWGLSYIQGLAQFASFYHNYKVVKSYTKYATGFIAILGPLIWVIPSITHLYQVIEAKAGDTLSASLSENIGGLCSGTWWGCLLHNAFFGLADTWIRIDLIALAESV